MKVTLHIIFLLKGHHLINYKEVKPEHPLISRYVHSYTYSIGDISEKEGKYITRAFPTFLTNFMFEFCGNLSEIHTDNKITSIDRRTYVNSGIGSWMDIFQIPSNSSRPIKNLKVDFYPNAVFDIFGISPFELIDSDIRVEDIWGNRSECLLLCEELEKESSGMNMVKIFEKYLLLRLKDITIADPYTPFFLNKQPDLKVFSKTLGYSPRWIQKKHQEVFGVSFKMMQNNMRFLSTLEHLNKLAASRKEINFSSFAQDHEYYDQAHFIKEFKRFTGMTPSEYVSKRFKDIVRFYW